MQASLDQKATLIGLAIVAVFIVGLELGRWSDKRILKEQDISAARRRSGRTPLWPKLMEWLEKKLRQFRFKLFLGAKQG